MADEYSKHNAQKKSETDEDINRWENLGKNVEVFFADIKETPYEWRELMKSPDALKDQFVTKIYDNYYDGKIDEKQLYGMEKMIENAFSFDPTVLASKQNIIDNINYQLGVEITRKKKENYERDEIEFSIMKHYKEEAVRRFNGMTSVDKMTKAAAGAERTASAIQKFTTGDTLQIVSGVLDITAAISEVLPPPASVITGTLSSILGIFMPGAGGPSNQEVIDKISDTINEGFEEQKRIMLQAFEDQKAFFQDKLEQAVEDVADELLKTKLEEIKIESQTILHLLNEKLTWLYGITTEKAQTPDELTRITSELNILADTEDTATIRLNFLSACKKRVIMETRVQDNSKDVQICMTILQNYFFIERFRFDLLDRFLSLRELEEGTSEVTASYWGVDAARKETIRKFIQEIFHDEEDIADTRCVTELSHTRVTGLKMKCYIGGDDLGIYTNNAYPPKDANQQYRDDIQQYIEIILGSVVDYTDTCKEATYIGGKTLI